MLSLLPPGRLGSEAQDGWAACPGLHSWEVVLLHSVVNECGPERVFAFFPDRHCSALRLRKRRLVYEVMVTEKALVPVGRERVPCFSSCSSSSYIIGKQAFPRPPGWSHSQFVVAKGSGGDEWSSVSTVETWTSFTFTQSSLTWISWITFLWNSQVLPDMKKERWEKNRMLC